MRFLAAVLALAAAAATAGPAAARLAGCPPPVTPPREHVITHPRWLTGVLVTEYWHDVAVDPRLIPRGSSFFMPTYCARRAAAGSSPPTPAARSSARTSTSSARPRASRGPRASTATRGSTSFPRATLGRQPSTADRIFARLAAGPRISSIFPHLPRADMRSFRIALAGGRRARRRALPAPALPARARRRRGLAVPLLFLLYLWDVDVYEDEPLIVLAFTVAWGALFGARCSATPRAAARARWRCCAGTPDTHNVVWLGVILPLRRARSRLAGPLILLPYRKFNDVLDGVTFGRVLRRDAARGRGDRELGRLPAPRLPRRRRPGPLDRAAAHARRDDARARRAASAGRRAARSGLGFRAPARDRSALGPARLAVRCGAARGAASRRRGAGRALPEAVGRRSR